MTGIIEAYGLLFFTALFLSLLVTPLTIRLARKLGVVDTPNERSMHTQSKTRLGGLGMAAGLGISVFVFLPFNATVDGFLAGLAVIVLVGLIDDIYQVRALYKLLGQIVVGEQLLQRLRCPGGVSQSEEADIGEVPEGNSSIGLDLEAFLDKRLGDVGLIGEISHPANVGERTRIFDLERLQHIGCVRRIQLPGASGAT